MALEGVPVFQAVTFSVCDWLIAMLDPDAIVGSAVVGCVNATLTGTELKKFAPLDPGCRRLLERSAERLHMSARAFHRVIRVSRTIADLADAETIALDHLGEALQYRFVEDASSLPNERRR